MFKLVHSGVNVFHLSTGRFNFLPPEYWIKYYYSIIVFAYYCYIKRVFSEVSEKKKNEIIKCSFAVTLAMCTLHAYIVTIVFNNCIPHRVFGCQRVFDAVTGRIASLLAVHEDIESVVQTEKQIARGQEESCLDSKTVVFRQNGLKEH